MTLHQHIKARGESVSAFCLRTGLNRNTINKIVYGQRQPSLTYARKIVEVTQGDVSFDELLAGQAA